MIHSIRKSSFQRGIMIFIYCTKRLPTIISYLHISSMPHIHASNIKLRNLIPLFQMNGNIDRCHGYSNSLELKVEAHGFKRISSRLGFTVSIDRFCLRNVLPIGNGNRDHATSSKRWRLERFINYQFSRWTLFLMFWTKFHPAQLFRTARLFDFCQISTL